MYLLLRQDDEMPADLSLMDASGVAQSLRIAGEVMNQSGGKLALMSICIRSDFMSSPCKVRPVSAREVAIVKRLLQQLVEMSTETTAGDNSTADLVARVGFVGLIRRSETARADPVLMQCCEALLGTVSQGV